MRIKQILYQKWPIHNSLFRTKLIFCSICMFSFKLSGRQKLFLKHKYQWIREYDNCSKRLDFDCWILLLLVPRDFFFFGGGFLWISTIYDLIIQREWSNIINIHFWVFIGAQVNNPFSLAHMVFSEMEECFVINCSPFSCCKLCIYCFYFLSFLDLSTFGCVRLCEKHLQKVIANHRWFWQSFFIKKITDLIAVCLNENVTQILLLSI